MKYIQAVLGAVVFCLGVDVSGEPVAIKVAPIEFANHAKTIVASGVVRPVSEQTLSFKVPGIVKRVTVQQGQLVKKGQLLAELEPEEMNAQVAKAQAVLTDAKRQLERLTALEGNKLTSDERIRQVKTTVEVAQSDLRIARFNQKYAQIHAPADGRILSRHIESNELVASGQPIYVFADDQQGWSVHMAVADVDVVKLNIGDHADIQLDAYPGELFTASIREIAGRAHPRTQTFEVDLTLKTKQRLYSGLIAHTKITPSVQTHVAKIPMSALIQAHGHDATLYVINEQGSAQLKTIKLAYVDAHFAYVKSGLAQGEKIVIEGGPFINNGKDIAIVKI
ncbi:MAG: efflux RND transporter periplasmic adaptor subunit [Bermanella sp.]